MVAVKTTLRSVSADMQPESCPECNGLGTVRYWNEVSYFEDLRSCSRCKAGRDVESSIARIIARAQAEERFPTRHNRD